MFDERFKYFNPSKIFRAAAGNSRIKLPPKFNECTFSAPKIKNKLD